MINDKIGQDLQYEFTSIGTFISNKNTGLK